MTEAPSPGAQREVRPGVIAGSSKLDGPLSAVVAADRLALAEAVQTDEQLLLRRLTLFYGYFAGVIGLSWLASSLSDAPPDWPQETVTDVLRIEGALFLALCAALAGLRLRSHAVQSSRGEQLAYLRFIDVAATVATALAAGAALASVPATASVDASAIAFFILFFVLRAALVPSQPWVATALTALCAVPFTIGLSRMYHGASPSPVSDPDEATATGIANIVAALGGVFIVSKTFYGLRGAVERAVQLGQYIIHEKIGEGGMGAVYRASHAMLRRPTAIKLIAPARASETAVARFEREVLAASRLSHPNHVAIYDFGRTRGGAFYYAMELIDGENLSALVQREGPLGERRTLHLLQQVAAALSEAHAAGLVHRDIKPENIMRCVRANEQDCIKILDFGLVKDAATPADAKLTLEGATAGTPLYMAPESLVAPETVGPAVDSYALGCVAYFLLTGRPPFEGKSLVEVCTQHIHVEAPAPSLAAPQPVSAALDALVLLCLHKQPSERPTMAELYDQLGRARDAGLT